MPNKHSFAIVAFLFGAAAYANERVRPVLSHELPGSVKKDQFVRVPHCEVAYVNEVALKRDFPQLAALSNKELEAWVLQNFGFVSTGQQAFNKIRNTEIPQTSEEKVVGYRPAGYGRAAVLEAKGLENKNEVIGLVDIKGIGLSETSFQLKRQTEDFKTSLDDGEKLDELRTKDHSDGLMSLGEGIAELSRQQALQMLFDVEAPKTGQSLETVENYFVIKYPFDILKDKGKTIPAAIIGRQAHFDRNGNYSGQSPGHFGSQETRLNGHLDFGNVSFKDPRLVATFGKSTGNAQKSNAWVYGHEVADAFSKGNKEVVYRHLSEMLAPLEPARRQLKLTSNGSLPQVQGIPGLLAILDDPDSPMHVEAADVLTRIKNPSADVTKALAGSVDKVARGLDSPLAARRNLSLQVLAQLRPASASVHFKIVQLLTDSDNLVKSSLLNNIARYHLSHDAKIEALKQIEKLLGNKDKYIRQRAVYAINSLGQINDTIKSKIVSMIDDEDRFVKSSVLRSIHQFRINAHGLSQKMIELEKDPYFKSEFQLLRKSCQYLFSSAL